jgi:hypothetical protein
MNSGDILEIIFLEPLNPIKHPWWNSVSFFLVPKILLEIFCSIMFHHALCEVTGPDIAKKCGLPPVRNVGL